MAHTSTLVCSRRLMARSLATRHQTTNCMITTFLGGGIAVLFFGGCSSAPRADGNTQDASETSSRLAYNSDGVAPLDVEVTALPENDSVPQAEFTGPASERVVAQTPATLSDLAATYHADLAALASMQATATSLPTPPASTNATPVAAPTLTPPPTAPMPQVEWSDGTQGAARDRVSQVRADAERALIEAATAAAVKTTAKPQDAPQIAPVEIPLTTSTEPQQTAANAPLSAVAPPVVSLAFPTDPAGIAARLAASLKTEAATSATPLRQLLALSALAVTDPSITLPTDLSAHLTDTERAMTEKFHAAFVRMGRELQEGKDDAALVSTIEQLLASIKPQPILSLPRVELCTRVQAFGQIDPIDNRRFLAASSPKVILYSELAHFISSLEDAKWTTRLATKISILTERDGVEVWRRNPEWTAVVDASDVKRADFFVGEIVTLSPHLSVGSYVMKLTIRDESTSTIAEKSIAFQVVADPAMVSNAG